MSAYAEAISWAVIVITQIGLFAIGIGALLEYTH